MDFNCSQFGSHSASQNDSQQSRKGTNTRRSWTDYEENCLIQAFKEILQANWKAENGFKNGFLHQLEMRMKILMPGTDIKATPHINSKYNTWKRIFKEIWACLNNSGFNWNSGTHKVVAPPSVWDDWIKAHPSSKEIRDKGFPHYYVWEEMFGADTVVGGLSRDILGNKRKSVSTPEEVNVDGDDDNVQEVPPNTNESPDNHSASTRTRGSTPPGNEGKKKKKMEGIEELTNYLTTCWKEATSAIDKFAVRMGHDKDEADGRKMLSAMVDELPLVLTMAQKLKACLSIGHDKETLDMFFGFNEDERCEVVKWAIDGTLKAQI